MVNRFPSISPAVEQVVHVGLAKNWEERFANIQAFANALEQASQVGGSIPTPLPIGNRSNTPAPAMVQTSVDSFSASGPVEAYPDVEPSSSPEPVVSLVSLAGPLLQNSQLELDVLPSSSMVNYILQEVGKRARARKLGIS